MGAWASKQSQPLSGRAELEACVAKLEARYQGQDVPRPPFWSGYLLTPDRVEFWKGRSDRLHDRGLYRWEAGRWLEEELLYP